MASAAGARLALLVAMVALPHVCAIRDSYDSDAVLGIQDQDKEVAQQQEVDLDTAALLGGHQVSQVELGQKVTKFVKEGGEPQLFVKNVLVAALPLADQQAVESIPQKILDSIGTEDKAKYDNGPKDFVGGAVILQFKVKLGKATPDFYLIPAEKWTSTYKTKPVADMKTLNEDSTDQHTALNEFLGESPHPKHLTGALKTKPTEMILFSKLGFPEMKKVEIKTVWGSQEKLAGVDAYLVIVRAEKEGDADSYYKCDMDVSKGLPEKYVSVEGHAFAADPKSE